MKLKSFKQQVKNEVPGQVAGLVKDAVNGDSLIIQSGRDQLIVKLSDLVAFIQSTETLEVIDEKTAQTE